MDYFFYGTLMDADVLACVLGRPVVPGRVERAVLDGYERLYLADSCYPSVVPQARASVEGCLVGGLDAPAAARIADFEGDLYAPRVLSVTAPRRGVVAANTFVAGAGVALSSEKWELVPWRRRYRDVYLDLLRP